MDGRSFMLPLASGTRQEFGHSLGSAKARDPHTRIIGSAVRSERRIGEVRMKNEIKLALEMDRPNDRASDRADWLCARPACLHFKVPQVSNNSHSHTLPAEFVAELSQSDYCGAGPRWSGAVCLA
jgi:hypothetical protein